MNTIRIIKRAYIFKYTHMMMNFYSLNARKSISIYVYNTYGWDQLIIIKRGVVNVRERVRVRYCVGFSILSRCDDDGDDSSLLI